MPLSALSGETALVSTLFVSSNSLTVGSADASAVVSHTKETTIDLQADAILMAFPNYGRLNYKSQFIVLEGLL